MTGSVSQRAVAPLLAAAAALVVGIGIGAGTVWILPGAIMIAALIFGITAPGPFIGTGIAVYGLIQAGMVSIVVFSIADVTVNASQVYVMGILAVSAVAVLGAAATRSQPIPKPPPSVIVQLALIASLVLPLGLSPFKNMAVSSFSRVCACAVMLYVAFWLGRRESSRGWVRVGLLACAGIAATSAVIGYAGARSSTVAAITIEAMRARGSFGNAVQTGTVCFAGLAFAFSEMAVAKSKVRRGLLLGLAFLLSMGVYATFTRTAILGVIIMGGVLIMMRREGRGVRGMLLYAGLLIVIISAGVWLMPQEAIEARTRDLPGMTTGNSASAPVIASGRNLIWSAVLDGLAESKPMAWIVGHGIESATEPIMRRTWMNVGAHNSFLQLLYDAGLLGALAYIAVCIVMLREFWRATRGVPEKVRAQYNIWFAYLVAYFASTEMLNHFVYSLGPRFLTWIGTGLLLARAVNLSSQHSEPANQ